MELMYSNLLITKLSYPLTVQFHIGYLYYMEGQFLAAKETFEGILKAKSVPNDIKAMSLRQLGQWYGVWCVCVEGGGGGGGGGFGEHQAHRNNFPLVQWQKPEQDSAVQVYKHACWGA